MLSFPHSLQQEAVLSLRMHDFASFPQQDLASLPEQHDAMSLLSELCIFCRAQQEPSALASDFAILSQQAHLLFSVGAVLCCGVEGAVGVAVCAHDATVRARMSANILCFMI